MSGNLKLTVVQHGAWTTKKVRDIGNEYIVFYIAVLCWARSSALIKVTYEAGKLASWAAIN